MAASYRLTVALGAKSVTVRVVVLPLQIVVVGVLGKPVTVPEIAMSLFRQELKQQYLHLRLWCYSNEYTPLH